MHKEDRNREIDEELQGYVEASVEEKVRRGMPRESATRAARAEVGSAAVVRHRVWSSGWEATAESLVQDVRFGIRQLLKSPGFSLVAILSLALGIGANTAIFTLINDLLLKSLPVHRPEQLVSFGRSIGGGTLGSVNSGPVDMFTYDLYKRIEREHAPFESVAAFGSFPTPVSVRRGAGERGAATQAVSHLVSGTFFDVLGVEAFLGRAISTNDTDAPGRNAVAVISYRYWQQELSADPAVIGRTLTINGTLFTVVGVMPQSFYGVELNEEMPDMWLPITMQQVVMQQQQGSLLDAGGMYWLHMIARRNAGVSAARAQAWTTTQLQQFMTSREGTQLPERRRQEIAASFVPLVPIGAGISHLRADYEAPLAVLMGVVVLVLLIACANLANFLLAKAASREREFTTRLALGSSRTRIVRQVLTETMLLAFSGGALGLLLAFLGTQGSDQFRRRQGSAYGVERDSGPACVGLHFGDLSADGHSFYDRAGGARLANECLGRPECDGTDGGKRRRPVRKAAAESAGGGAGNVLAGVAGSGGPVRADAAQSAQPGPWIQSDESSAGEYEPEVCRLQAAATQWRSTRGFLRACRLFRECGPPRCPASCQLRGATGVHPSRSLAGRLLPTKT